MPLKLTLCSGERLVINGAVIRNDGHDANLVFENQANVLRQKDILGAGDASTPARRAYLSLQCAYMFPERDDRHLADFERLIDEFVDAAPSARDIVDGVRGLVHKGRLYSALKDCRKLIDHETELLSYVQ